MSRLHVSERASVLALQELPFSIFIGMGRSYAPYQMPGLTAGLPMGIQIGSPSGPPFGPSMGMPLLEPLAQPRLTATEWLTFQGFVATQQALAATQQALPPPNLGAPSIRPTPLQIPQAIVHHAQAATTNAAVRLEVEIDLRSISPQCKIFDHGRFGNHPLYQSNSNRGRGRGHGGRGGAHGRSDGHGGGRRGGHGAGQGGGVLDVEDNREVDVIVAGNGVAVPGTLEEDGRRMATRIPIHQARRIMLPSILLGSEGGSKSTKRTLATDSNDSTSHMDQLEHQTGNDEASRTWKRTSEHLDEGGKKAPSFLVLWLVLSAMVVRVFHPCFGT